MTFGIKEPVHSTRNLRLLECSHDGEFSLTNNLKARISPLTPCSRIHGDQISKDKTSLEDLLDNTGKGNTTITRSGSMQNKSDVTAKTLCSM